MVLWWVWLAFAVASLVALAAGSGDHSAVVTAVLLVAITGVVYGCALRPRIVADDDGITMANPLRDHTVPWRAVTRVDLGDTLRVHCVPAPGAARGKVLHSWALQSPRRSRMRGELRARRSAQRTGRDSASYARLPDEARDVLAGTHAEFVARQLDERAARYRKQGAAPAPGGPAGLGESGGLGGTGGTAKVRWAWGRIAVMALPVLALIIVAAA